MDSFAPALSAAMRPMFRKAEPILLANSQSARMPWVGFNRLGTARTSKHQRSFNLQEEGRDDIAPAIPNCRCIFHTIGDFTRWEAQ